MDDFEDLPVETLAGERPEGAVADRLLIGLAAIALFGGLMIAAANLLSGFLPGTAAVESTGPTPLAADPTATLRPSPTERPLREVSVIPGAPPVFDEEEFGGFATTYWVEALARLPIHDFPGSGEVLGHLAPGEITLAEEQPWEDSAEGWLFAHGAQPPGWIPTVGRGGRPLARLHLQDQPSNPGTIRSVSAGANGFVAHGSLPVTGWEPPEQISMFSADGQRWSRAALQGGPWGGRVAAWGPSGWLATSSVTLPQGIQTTWLWESASGVDWSPVGELDFRTGDSILSFVGSERGYLLALASTSNATVDLWFSPDGLVWQESRGSVADLDPSVTTRYGPEVLQVAASDAGFLTWMFKESEQRGIVGAYSPDGRGWLPIEMASETGAAWLRLAVTGDRIVGFGRDDFGTVQAYSAALVPAEGVVVLERASHLEVAFDGAIVWSLVSDGETAYAFGADLNDGSDLAWSGTGTAWRRIATPDESFGIPVTMAAAGPAGVLAVGVELNGVAFDPVLWHLRTDGRWARSPGNIIPPAPKPSAEDCGDLPDTAVEFMGLHPTIAVPCFGDRPMTFTAWSISCSGCFSGSRPPSATSWLLDPAIVFFLLPIEDRSEQNGYTREAVLAPDVEWQDSYAGAWLRVTGHYNDRASADCREAPSPMEEFYPGPLLLETICRQRFVVTEVTVVDGPSS